MTAGETDEGDAIVLDGRRFAWFHGPGWWEPTSAGVRVRSREGSDFWRETFYGFVHDDGHFLHTAVAGDFTAEVTVRGRYEALYDQAGLMVRVDERNWLKAGIEYTDGAQHFSVVVTCERSDWSVVRLTTPPAVVEVRLTRHDSAFRIPSRVPGEDWRMARLAWLPAATTVEIGPLCCSPTRDGFEAEFEHLRIGAPIARNLHD
jgi:uncharacterized protein